MPYKSGLIQAALGAVSAVGILIANSGTSGDAKHKRLTGIVQKAGKESFVLTEANARQHTFKLGESASVFLNERAVPLDSVENGRKATVRFYKKKGQLVAINVDVFPNHADFESGVETPGPQSS